MASCLYKQSQISKGSDRLKRLEQAEKFIGIARTTDKTLGGKLLERKYNALLKTVQSEIKKNRR